MPSSGLLLRGLERRIEAVDRFHLELEDFPSAVHGVGERRLVRPEGVARPFDRTVASPSRGVEGFPVAVQRFLGVRQGEYVERIRIPTGGATARVRHNLPRALRDIEDIASERDGSPLSLVGSSAVRRPWEGPARPPSSTSVQR